MQPRENREPDSYDVEYVTQARAEIAARVDAFRELASTGRDLSSDDADWFDASVDGFEPVYFNDLVIVLDRWFVDRAGDGAVPGALDEVRLLVDSLTSNGGRVRSGSQGPAGSPAAPTPVLGYISGDDVAVRQEEFVLLAEAFLTRIETGGTPG